MPATATTKTKKPSAGKAKVKAAPEKPVAKKSAPAPSKAVSSKPSASSKPKVAPKKAETAPTARDTSLIDAVIALSGPDEIAARKLLADVKDRATYIVVTGAFPTHLRPETLAILRQATTYSSTPTALDGESGGVAIRDEYREALELDAAPMVRKVQEFVAAGWRVQPERDERQRRPYGRVWLYRPVSEFSAQRCTVHASGAVQAEWV